MAMQNWPKVNRDLFVTLCKSNQRRRLPNLEISIGKILRQQITASSDRVVISNAKI